MMKHMVMATYVAIVVMLLLLVAPTLSGNSMAWPLQYDYYSSSCPKAEAVVRKTTAEIITGNPTMGAAFLNMFFYDCFNQGCDASLLLDPTEEEPEVEKSWMPKHLRAYDAVDRIKEAVEAVCPGVVSCTDIIALAACDSVTISGGFSFPMPTGRRDTLVSIAYDDDEPPNPNFMLHSLIDIFAIRGLDVDDLVALSGAHSFGISHCNDVIGYPTFAWNSTFADELRRVCPPRSHYGEMGPVLNNNRVTDPNVLSNQYYSNVLSGRVLFLSDLTLLSRNDTAAKVAYFASNPLAWKAHFAKALVKMGGVRVSIGTLGEVRKVCNATNN